jgi:FkbM family methyltransferase
MAPAALARSTDRASLRPIVATDAIDTSGHAYVTPKEGLYQAQHGEDRWLEKYFRGKRDGFFVEVGAYDGIVLSNSYYFEAIGWQGILVEPDPGKAAKCRSNRPRSRVFECAAVTSPTATEVVFYAVENGEVYSTINMTDEHRERMSAYGLIFSETRVAARTLDSILEAAECRSIDLLTIDVEEAELEVLHGFDIKRWRPAVVMVETNSRFRKADIRSYFVENGYVFRHSIDINDFYVPLRPHRLMTGAIDTGSYVLHRGLRAARRRLRKLLPRF